MTEFWENAFKVKQEMWGSAPAKTAVLSAEMFAKKGLKKILIPGIGYGRNATPFLNKGMAVTGIEISETAIKLAERNFGESLKIHQGSVTEMKVHPGIYDGIFCHALIRLLGENERKKFIADCFYQLTAGGSMILSAITKDASTFRQGTLISRDRYEQFGGLNMFFYDPQSIQKEFANHGLHQIETVQENYPFYLIQCNK
ncbi:class I SAM-dependent methyltransferase [Sphingobacterium sp.]|uniref:class I SAM-dependent methyltransferase n=1 Tax=Sphingobacterium sp. TaxID=341027 RepID=UPI0028AF316F|nr:class I SAM-dependent methyltransferase [Sphingobacterium sp.]